MNLPVIARFQPTATRRDIARAKTMATVIRAEHPQIDGIPDSYQFLKIDSTIEDSPSLVLDDFSEIPLIGLKDTAPVVQRRARWRATSGDFVPQSQSVEPGFSDYCEYKLGLGRVNWLYPTAVPNAPRQLAFQCWQDRRVRHDLIQAVRRDGLRYIHPHLSTLHVWELAAQLHNATRRPISVIGPPHEVARWANNKIEFTRTAARLFGKQSVPHTEAAFNFATLSKKVACLASTHTRLGIKYPYATGGNGNFRIDATRIRGLSLSQVRDFLKQLLAGNRWPQHGRLLLDVWESDVLCSPSVQTWIPPLGHGVPVMEGLFKQTVSGDQGAFVGSCPLELPDELEQQIINNSYLLAVLFQELGYVGRCSFDLIMAGEQLENCRIEFIECNARWGGTSIPMTLMNRLQIEPPERTYSFQNIKVPGLDKISFARLLRELDADLYDPGTGLGSLILTNPGRVRAESAIDAIAIGSTTCETNRLLAKALPSRLAKILRQASITTENGTATKISPANPHDNGLPLT